MTAAHPSPFGDLLRRYRAAAGLTQEELANKAGLSAKGIGDLERGARQTPRRDTVHLLAEALGLAERDRTILEAAARRRGRGSTANVAALGTESHRGATSESVPFVGREAELARIDRHLQGDSSPLLLVAGEPGIGKSRLLHEAAMRAPVYGWVVLAGGCHRRSGQEPYAPFVGLLDRHLGRQPAAERRMHLQGCAWLVRLLPELAEILPPPAYASGLPPDQERRLMFTAVARYFANVAGPAGVLLILDDLQWAGPDALDLLAFMLRMADGERSVRIIGAYRDTEVRTADPFGVLIADLVSSDLAQRTSLHPLAMPEATTLLESLLPERAEDGSATQVQQILQRAGGVPFFLLSCAQGLRTGALVGDAGTSAAALPWNVSETIRQRLAALAEETRELLGLAAVIGRTVPHALLVATATRMGHPQGAAVAALDQARTARLFEEDGERGYAFAHDIVREVIAADLGTARRALFHLHVAEALEASPGAHPAELLAHHFGQASEQHRAIPYLKRAAERASAACAVADAESYYRELIARLDELEMALEAAHARVELGRMLNSISRHADALVLLETAARSYRALGDADGAAHATIHMAWAEGMRANASEGQRLLRPLLDPDVLTSVSAETAAELFALVAAIPVFVNNYLEQLEAAERAVEYAQIAGNQVLVAQGQLGRAYAHFSLGHISEAAAIIHASLPLIESSGTVLTQFQSLAMVIGMDMMRADMATARADIDRCLNVTLRLDDPAMQAFATDLFGWWLYLTGDWHGAVEQYERALALLRTPGPTWATPYAYYYVGLMRAVMGQYDEASELLDQALALARNSKEVQALRWTTLGMATLDLLLHRPERAIERIVPLLDQSVHQERDVTMLLTCMARAYLMLGDMEQADEVSSQAIARARSEPNRHFLVNSLSVRAFVRLRQSRFDEATEAVAEGVKIARDIGFPFGEAQMLETAGMIAAQAGAGDASGHPIEQLNQALAIYERLGAAPYAAAVRDELTRLRT